MSSIVQKVATALLFLIIALCAAIVVVPPFLDRIYYEGQESAHYDGARFFNPDGEDTAAPPTGGSRAGFLFRYLTSSDGRPPWPARVDVRPPVPAARVEGDRMVATWIGHATVLIQTQGLNILTDPIYAETAGPFGLGPQRVTRPGVAFDDLPRIDLVLVSHNHYDHMDLETLKRLWDRDKPLIVTSLGNDSVLRTAAVPAKALDWGSGLSLRPGVAVTVTRNHHWGSRWGSDRNRALWSSFVVTLPGGNIMFAGDTGMGDGQWPAEAARLGPVRLALIPIGAFRFVPGQMGIGSHIGPIDAAEVFVRSRASRAIAVHWGTFRLSYEAYATPPRLLDAVMRCRGLTGYGAVAIGRPVEIPAYVPQRPGRPLDPACLDTPAVRALR